ncbi:TPA: cysteine desulfurase [bacterium]|jgi:cysteine desulfurase|nr:cysteine desulfurase [bacterium]
MIYLDNAATTRTDDEILDDYYKLCKKYYANASSNHYLGREAARFLNASRKQIASLLGVKNVEVYFTSGATESNNIAIIGTCHAHKKRGKHLITTKIEHPSVLNVFKYLEKEGYEVTYLSVDSSGVISLDELKEILRNDTILVSIMGVNNEIGSIMPISECGRIIKENSNAYFHVDATQLIGKHKINMTNIDFLSFSAHKIHGLKGSGALIKKENVRIEPIIFGGKQEEGLRPGTLNWQVDVMLAKTLRKALENMDEKRAYIEELRDYLFDELSKIDKVYLNSTKKGSPYIINFSLEGYPSEVVVSGLEDDGFLVSTLSACSTNKVKKSYVLEALNLEPFRASSSIRVSLNQDITKKDLEGFIESLKKILNRIGGNF